MWDCPKVKAREHRLLGGLQVNLSGRAVKGAIRDHYTTMKRQLTKSLQGRMLSLKFDLATRRDRHFLGVSVQFIDDWRVAVRHIGVMPVYSSQTAVQIKEEVMYLLCDFEIKKDMIYSVTTDNGANVLKATGTIMAETKSQMETEEEEESDEESDTEDSECIPATPSFVNGEGEPDWLTGFQNGLRCASNCR